MDTAEDEVGKEPRPDHSNGANGARSDHGALARRKYNILASETAEGYQSSAEAADGEDGHGASEEREGPRTAGEGDKNPQHALPAHETSGGQIEARGPTERSRALNASGRRGGEGAPHPAAHANSSQRGYGGGGLIHQRGIPLCDRAQDAEGGPPAPAAPKNRGRAGGGGGQAARTHIAQANPRRRGGPPQTAACAPSAWYASEGRGGLTKP